MAIPKAARKSRMSGFIEPCLATAASAPPAGEKWVHEIKFDGYRLQPALEKGGVTIRTRRGLDWTDRFPSIAKAIAALPVKSAIFDGEAVVEDKSGIADFAALQDALKAGREQTIVFYMFDLLYLNGFDLRALPLAQRKDLLEQALANAPRDGPLRYSAHFATNGEDLLSHICRLGAEGVVSKRIDKPYRSGRGADWLKAKCANRQEFVIIGYTPSTVTSKAFGALVLGYYDHGKLLHAGRAGTGYSLAMATTLFTDLEKIGLDHSPVEGPLAAEAKRNIRWVTPMLVAEIEFRGWTASNMLRQASFKALRVDKAPSEVFREAADPPREGAPAASQRTSINLTHPDRLLWLRAGFTKQALADYYSSAWPFIAPHIVGRPLALVRCPNGVDQGCFFQRRQWDGADSHIARIADPDEERALVGIDDFDGLVALVQASVLEIHPWGAKADKLATPDRLIFDLDPGDGVGWSDLVAAALEVRARLRHDALESFVKTSGGKGLHVVTPIEPRSGWEEAQSYCRAIAEAMAADSPDRFTATMAKRERSGRIYVDYLRNSRGATAVAAYSTRARPEAGVAMPLDWGELDEIMRADHFTLANAGRRLDNLNADPWRSMEQAKHALPARNSRSKRASR